MAFRDIVLGVETDFDQKKAIRQLKAFFAFIQEQGQIAEAEFAKLEDTANRTGESVAQLAGITDNTAASWSSLRSATSDMNRELSRLRFEALEPYAVTLSTTRNLFTDLVGGVGDYVQALKSLGAEIGGSETPAHIEEGGGIFGRLRRRAGRFFSNRLQRESPDQDLREQQLRNEDSRFRLQIGLIKQDFANRKDAAAEAAKIAQQDLFSTARQRTRFAGQQRELFDQFQQIDRDTFRRQQRAELDAPSLLPRAFREEQQRVRLRQFDIRQQASAEKRGLSDQLKVAQNLERLETNSEKQISRLDRQIELMEQQRDASLRALGPRAAGLIDEVDAFEVD